MIYKTVSPFVVFLPPQNPQVPSWTWGFFSHLLFESNSPIFKTMPNEKERRALFAKGRLLFDSCSAENDYACVLGYIDYNLSQGSWRAEVMAEFIDWLMRQRDTATQHAAHATAILQRLENEYN